MMADKLLCDMVFFHLSLHNMLQVAVAVDALKNGIIFLKVDNCLEKNKTMP